MNTKTPLFQKCGAALLPLCLILIMGSCNKNIDYFVPDPGQIIGPDTNWVNNITAGMPIAGLKNRLLLKPFTDSLDLQKNDTIDNSTGLKCIVPANSFIDSLGNISTGKVVIEIIHLTKKGDFIRMDQPTTADSTVLSSAGAISIKVLKPGSTLLVGQSGRLGLQVYNPSFTTLNKLYFGERNINAVFNWFADLPGTRNEIVTNNFGYEIKTNRLGWIAASKPLESVTFTNIALNLPAQYTNANTTAYLVYNDTKSVVALHGNADLKKFGGTLLPGGKAATIVLLSQQGNDYYATFKPITTGTSSSNQTYQLETISPTKTTMDAIQLSLNAL